MNPISIQEREREVSATKPALIAKRIPVRIAWEDPETGKEQHAEVFSVVPVDEDRIGRICADLAGGRPWVSLPPRTQARFFALARVTVQVDNLKSCAWLGEALERDTDLLLALNAKLAEHESRWFRRNGAEGEGSSPSFRLAIPALDAPSPGPA